MSPGTWTAVLPHLPCKECSTCAPRMHLTQITVTHAAGTLISDLIVVVCLVIIGGVMSGLTLGLMSLDTLDMEVQ